ncbi:MAG: tetratricopeptide repeat protein [Treponema sp.]|nr:tetratricopeptide repeat protein [Treponema sp.]
MKDDTNPQILSPEEGAVPDKEKLRQWFESKAGARILIVKDIGRHIENLLLPILPHPTVKVRTKSFSSFYTKHSRQLRKGITPHITDLMGIRIVCPFLNDMAQVEKIISDHFEVIELDRKGGLYTHKEFGYESIHLLIKIPYDLTRVRGNADCDVVEIQIRTILQDAWAEVEHEIFYKGEFSPLDSQRRKLSAINASLFLADTTFQEIRSYQKKLNSQLMERRENFYQKIEHANDAFFISDIPTADQEPKTVSSDSDGNSIDELLLKALTAHNNKQFEKTIAIYSQILERDLEDPIRSLIYKHRGVANFAQSKYDEAVSDFTEAFKLDEKSHMSVYYRGLVYSVLNQYTKAIEDFTLSLRINPYQYYCLFRRGQAYYHMGDSIKALSDCNASLSMEPNNDKIQKFRELLQDGLQL